MWKDWNKGYQAFNPAWRLFRWAGGKIRTFILEWRYKLPRQLVLARNILNFQGLQLKMTYVLVLLKYNFNLFFFCTLSSQIFWALWGINSHHRVNFVGNLQASTPLWLKLKTVPTSFFEQKASSKNNQCVFEFSVSHHQYFSKLFIIPHLFLILFYLLLFQLLNKLDKLNNDPNVHGIIVQMPLDSVTKINSHIVTDSVCPSKDIDGWVDYINFFCGKLINNNRDFKIGHLEQSCRNCECGF